jgi:hypothetical protein
MRGIEEIFSGENLLAYSGACLELAARIPERKKLKPFDTLLIPSRGAVPFFIGMRYGLKKVAQLSSDHEDFLNGLEISPLLPSIGEEAQTAENSSKRTNVLLVPFTADLNIGQFDPTQSNDEYTKKTRIYWANVTSAMFRDREQRLRNPHFRSFTDITLKDIERRSEIAEFYCNFPKIQRFAMIDTVISGRASNDILQAFDNLAIEKQNPDLMPAAFLVVDENGHKLNRVFASYLNRKTLGGQVEMFYVPRIVSEDEGASLLGVAATVYPSVMRASKSLRLYDQEFFVGAGSWHTLSSLKHEETYAVTFKKFMDVINKGIDTVFQREYSQDDDHHTEAIFENARRDLVKHLIDYKVLSHHDVNVGFLGLNKRYSADPKSLPYETHSKVVHIPFDPVSTNNITSKLCGLSPHLSYVRPG